MTQSNKYIWLRNFALLSTCGFLCYSLFPFPPISWRLLFLGTAIITIWPNAKCLTQLEKTIIIFWGLNLIYFFASYLWLDRPSTSQIGNISVTLLAIPLYGILGRKGLFTERFNLVAVMLLLISSFIYFESLKLVMLARFIGRDAITNNASTVFLYILPFILLLKNRLISYCVAIVCAYFLMEGAKRGNIVFAIPIILLFVVLIFRDKQVKVYEKFLFVIIFLFAISWGSKRFSENEYLQKRVEETIEGDSSNRDKIYSNAWNVYSESESVRNIIFGYGFDATINNKKIGNYAHNDWLEILVDYGAVGIVFYLSIFILLYKQIRKTKKLQKRFVLSAVFLVWFSKSLLSMGFTEETTFVLFMLLGGVTQGEEPNTIKQ